MYIPHFVYLFICGQTGCFHFLVMENNVAMTHTYKYLFKSLLSILLDIYLGVKLPGQSYGSSVFHHDCTILYSHQQ